MLTALMLASANAKDFARKVMIVPAACKWHVKHIEQTILRRVYPSRQKGEFRVAPPSYSPGTKILRRKIIQPKPQGFHSPCSAIVSFQCAGVGPKVRRSANCPPGL